LLRNKH